jgi:hypothetical protein
MLAMLLSTALAADWVVDPSSLSPAVGRWAVRSAVDCPSPAPDDPVVQGQRLHTLGVAAVIYSRKQGTMAWGHASVRVLSCRDGQPHDAEYETYRFGPLNQGEIERVLAGQAVLDDAPYLRAQRGALFHFRNDDPVDGGFFAQSHEGNREIYELWLDRDPDELDAMVVALEARLDEQQRRLDARQPLLGRYHWWSTNCTVPLQDLLGHPEWAMPFRWLRELRDDARLRVLHPSEHLVRRWSDELPARVERRPRPVFRRAGALPSMGDRAPVLPLESGGD